MVVPRLTRELLAGSEKLLSKTHEALCFIEPAVRCRDHILTGRNPGREDGSQERVAIDARTVTKWPRQL
jgi:hypothetical protein